MEAGKRTEAVNRGVDWGLPIAELLVSIRDPYVSQCSEEGSPSHFEMTRDGVRCKDLWLSALPAAPPGLRNRNPRSRPQIRTRQSRERQQLRLPQSHLPAWSPCPQLAYQSLRLPRQASSLPFLGSTAALARSASASLVPYLHRHVLRGGWCVPVRAGAALSNRAEHCEIHMIVSSNLVVYVEEPSSQFSEQVIYRLKHFLLLLCIQCSPLGTSSCSEPNTNPGIVRFL
jgi:hypothetical protein